MPVYMKGANWIPVHSFPVLDKMQKERYRHLLRSAKEANFNMIRVWGGGIYEPDFFYELCDSLGIYVWQDFDYSCALYPDDKDFLQNASIEATEQVRRLAKHKCIVLWCGNNEVKNGWEDWGWQKKFGYTPQQCHQIEANMDTLFGEDGILARAVKQYAPGKPYIPTSPTWGWGHEESAKKGDAHYWGVWWGELPFESYRDMTGRFMSEYGFMSYPEINTIRRFFPEIDQLMDSATAADMLTLPALLGHQKHPRGIAIIDQALQRYFGVTSRDVSFPRYLYLTQLCGAYGTGLGMEAHRIRKGHCWGTLYWQLNDCWPVASWSSIDFYGNWKALHYAAKRLLGDIAVLTEPTEEDGGVNIYVVSDNKPIKGKLLLSLCDFQNNTVQQEEEETASGKSHYYRLPGGVEKENVVLWVQLYDENDIPLAEKLHYFVPPKRLHLPQANVACNMAADGTVSIVTDNLAFGIALRTEPYVAGHFSDSYFDLMPSNKPHTVKFFPKQSPSTKKVKIVAEWYNR
ncbi:MAG: glycoside hydrolase family 2 protein [Bacteroidales bacterium]|nr:glycoside hydrolase family 2 protein [Bacteroidales bacterium]